MIQKTNINEVRKFVKKWKNEGMTVGFVPTMGNLHQGHFSLIDEAVKGCDKVIVSIFVNPLQFSPHEDFDRYPRSLDRDLEGCEKYGADLVFAPLLHELLPAASMAFVDVGHLGNHLCGRSRPGHFRGVCTIIVKLFNILSPDKAYFGEKDAQQLAIVSKLVRDLNFQVEIVPCPIIREADGLAMSSRNVYLTPHERKAARSISRSLEKAGERLVNGERNPVVICTIILNEIAREPLSNIDYVEVVDAETLEPVDIICKPILVAVAVFFGKTRLIDNFTFKEVSNVP